MLVNRCFSAPHFSFNNNLKDFTRLDYVLNALDCHLTVIAPPRIVASLQSIKDYFGFPKRKTTFC